MALGEPKECLEMGVLSGRAHRVPTGMNHPNGQTEKSADSEIAQPSCVRIAEYCTWADPPPSNKGDRIPLRVDPAVRASLPWVNSSW